MYMLFIHGCTTSTTKIRPCLRYVRLQYCCDKGLSYLEVDGAAEEFGQAVEDSSNSIVSALLDIGNIVGARGDLCFCSWWRGCSIGE